MHGKQRGFSLIEIMIVIVIIGILAAIGLPSYQRYIETAMATQATSALTDMQSKIEQYYQDNMSYVGFPCNFPDDIGGDYRFQCNAVFANSYVLEAIGDQEFTYGNVFTINQNSEKGSTFHGENGTTCWITKRGETC